MLHAESVISRKGSRTDRSVPNGILITHRDLSNPQDSIDSGQPSSVYVKPLEINAGSSPVRVQYDDQNSNTQAFQMSLKSPRPLEKSTNARTLHVDYRRHASGSQSASRLNRISFARHTAARRSLGGISDPSAWLTGDQLDESPTDDPFPSTPDPVAGQFEPNVQFRISGLPSVDDLGCTLDPFVHPQTGHFIGVQLRDRYRNRNIRPTSSESCPFRPGDIVLTVNQFKVSSLPESQAVQHVCNAFRDARNYAVEFGVHRPAEDLTNPGKEASDGDYKFSTLPVRSVNRYRFSELCFPGSFPTDDIPINPHQPLRSVRQPTPSGINTDVHNGRHDVSNRPMAPDPNLDSTASNEGSGHGSLKSKPSAATHFLRSWSTAPIGEQATTSASSRHSLSVEPRQSMSPGTAKSLNAFNTRTIGQKITIDLVKSVDGGLGFTLTSRDTQITPLSGEPVYVKTILSTGAAIADGRLMVGDRLLTVDGKKVENLREVLSQLRQIRPGSSVSLLVSRHASAPDDSKERKSARTVAPSSAARPRPYRPFTFEFALPAQSKDSVNLGVNFKWVAKTSDTDCPGLYVESLMPNGLISTAGRPTLIPGDRLVGVNGESLEGLSAKVVSSLIKRVLQGDAASVSGTPQPTGHPRHFSLTVHRYTTSEEPANHSGYRSMTSMDIRLSDRAHPQTPTTLKRHRDSARRMSAREKSSSDVDQPHDRTDNAASTSDSEPNSRSSLSPRFSSVPRRLLAESSFDREGFGRRSVSEKRHGHINPAQFTFYQTNILPNRYKMPEDVDKQYSTMPTARRLKLHKERMSASGVNEPLRAFDLSKLAAASSSRPTENTANDLPSKTKPAREENHKTPDMFHRGRKQNSSFRNAVDRSLTLTSPQTTSLQGDTCCSSSSSATDPDRRVSSPFVKDSPALVDTKLLQTVARESIAGPATDPPAPSLPPRQRPVVAASSPDPTSHKVSKGGFSTLKGLFRRATKKTASVEQSDSKPPETPNNPHQPSPLVNPVQPKPDDRQTKPQTPSRSSRQSRQSNYQAVALSGASLKADSPTHFPLPNGKLSRVAPDPMSDFVMDSAEQVKHRVERKRTARASPPPPPLPPRTHVTYGDGSHGPKPALVPSAFLTQPHPATAPTSPVVRVPKARKNSSRTRSPVYVPKPIPKSTSSGLTSPGNRRNSAAAAATRSSDYGSGHSRPAVKPSSEHAVVAKAVRSGQKMRRKSLESHAQLYATKEVLSPQQRPKLAASFKPERPSLTHSLPVASDRSMGLPTTPHPEHRTSNPVHPLHHRQIPHSTKAAYPSKATPANSRSSHQTDLRARPTKTTKLNH